MGKRCIQNRVNPYVSLPKGSFHTYQGLFLMFHYHTGTKNAVNLQYGPFRWLFIVVLRGKFVANSGSPVADERYFYHL